MTANRWVLVIEDHGALSEHIASTLRSALPGFSIVTAGSLSEARAVLLSRSVTAVWSDLGLPDAHCLDTLGVVQDLAKDAPVVVFSGSTELAPAVTALGVAFFAKPAEFSAACDYIARLVRARDDA